MKGVKMSKISYKVKIVFCFSHILITKLKLVHKNKTYDDGVDTPSHLTQQFHMFNF